MRTHTPRGWPRLCWPRILARAALLLVPLIGSVWQERAAIAEFDGRLSREAGEEVAWCEANAFLALIECGSGKSPAGSGVTSQWLTPPLSYYGDATLR